MVGVKIVKEGDYVVDVDADGDDIIFDQRMRVKVSVCSS